MREWLNFIERKMLNGKPKTKQNVTQTNHSCRRRTWMSLRNWSLTSCPEYLQRVWYVSKAYQNNGVQQYWRIHIFFINLHCKRSEHRPISASSLETTYERARGHGFSESVSFHKSVKLRNPLKSEAKNFWGGLVQWLCLFGVFPRETSQVQDLAVLSHWIPWL